MRPQKAPKQLPRGLQTASGRPPKGFSQDPNEYPRGLRTTTQARRRDGPKASRGPRKVSHEIPTNIPEASAPQRRHGSSMGRRPAEAPERLRTTSLRTSKRVQNHNAGTVAGWTEGQLISKIHASPRGRHRDPPPQPRRGGEMGRQPLHNHCSGGVLRVSRPGRPNSGSRGRNP